MKKKTGFALLTPARRKEIARRGGKAAHAQQKAHQYTAAEARAAGAKGGRAAHAKGVAHRFTHEEAVAAGEKGRSARRQNRQRSK